MRKTITRHGGAVSRVLDLQLGDSGFMPHGSTMFANNDRPCGAAP